MKVKNKSNRCVVCGQLIFGINRCRSCHMTWLNNGISAKSQFRDGHKTWVGKHLSEEHRSKLRTRRLGMKLNDEWREKIRLSKLGHNNAYWRGGITPENAARFNQYRWKKVTREVRKRDGYMCQSCGRYPSFDVHHQIPWRDGGLDESDNLITLCKACHLRVERQYVKTN